jgi:hypothetical protein
LQRVEQLSDLLRCTFFDWDSVVFDLRTGQLLFDDAYLRRLKLGLMDLRLASNPNPAGSLVRALRRAALWRVRFGRELSEFSRYYLSVLDWQDLVERDKAAFGDAVLAHLDRAELTLTLETTDEVAGTGSTFPVPQWERQPKLPFSQTDATSLSPHL